MLFKSGLGKKIIEKTKIANTGFTRFKGLMFEQEKNFDYGLIFELSNETRVGASIHMMFVFFPIDVIYLDAKKKVVDKATVNPWVLNYTPKKASKYFIELPEGIGKQISIGEKLDWK